MLFVIFVCLRCKYKKFDPLFLFVVQRGINNFCIEGVEIEDLLIDDLLMVSNPCEIFRYNFL